MCAFGHCFRTEAGAAGAAGKGLYRVHQFSKVEMFVLSTPEQSDVLHDELLQIEEDLFAELGLHFKILDMPTQVRTEPRGLPAATVSHCTSMQVACLLIQAHILYPLLGPPSASLAGPGRPRLPQVRRGGVDARAQPLRRDQLGLQLHGLPGPEAQHPVRPMARLLIDCLGCCIPCGRS